MEPREEQFLIAEYNQSWQVITAIDERRGKFLQSISALIIAAIGAVGFLISGKSPLPLSSALEASAILLFTALVGLATMNILRAERDSNIRYRKKANLIRQALLATSTDPIIKTYLDHKELGIKLPGDEEPKGLGETLTGMFTFLYLELAGVVVAFGYVWARHSGYFAG